MQNSNFDTKAASERLEQLAIERAAFRRAGVQLAELTRLKDWASSYKVYQSNTDSKTWHIVHKKDNIEMVDPKELEELVVSIQGIIWKQDLPPFTQEIRRPTQNRKRFLRQSVTLTGCGTDTFERGLETIMDVQALFDRHIAANKIDECTFIDKFDNYLGIHLTNRYFTPRWESPAEEAVPFAPGVDPSGILAALAGHEFFHGEQNVVKYHNRNVVQGGAVKYESISPVRFRVGDIVEAKATLTLVPIREGRFKLSAVLRSLTLLDPSFAQTSAQASNMRIKKLMQAPTSPTLKRTITYVEEEEIPTAPKKRATSSGLEGNDLNPGSSSSTTTGAAPASHTQGTQVAEKEKGKNADSVQEEKENDEPMAIDD